MGGRIISGPILAWGSLTNIWFLGKGYPPPFGETVRYGPVDSLCLVDRGVDLSRTRHHIRIEKGMEGSEGIRAPIPDEPD